LQRCNLAEALYYLYSHIIINIWGLAHVKRLAVQSPPPKKNQYSVVKEQEYLSDRQEYSLDTAGHKKTNFFVAPPSGF